MEIYLIYTIKVILLQSILFGLYWMTCRKSSSFQFNRFFLLAALTLPFFIPLIRIPITFFQAQLTSEGAFDPWFFIEQSLPGVVISGGHTVNQDVNWWIIFSMTLYLCIAIPSLFNFVADYYKIYQLGKKSVRSEYTPMGYRLLYVPSKILSFSFLNRIFLSNLFKLKNHEKSTIITHEEYHLTHRHSIDIILSEIIRIFCWFNPVVMLIQKNLKETHEYLADQHTIVKYGRNDYTSLLKSFKWQEINMMLGSAYSSSSIKNRLKMIETTDHKKPYVQIILLSVIALFTAFLFACENDLDSFENKDSGFKYEFSEADLREEIDFNLKILKAQNAPQDLIDLYVSEQSKHPEYFFIATVMNFAKTDFAEQTKEKILAGLKRSLIENEVIYFKQINDAGEPSESMRIIDEDQFNPPQKKYGIIQKYDRLQYMENRFKSNTEDAAIHDDFDKAAQFKGGMEALAKHLKENLKYPEIAKSMEIEGKLVMRFVVSKHGGLVYLNVEKEPETSNEEVSVEFQKAAFAALRSTEGLWEPAEKDGKYVMSKMILPIQFSLEK